MTGMKMVIGLGNPGDKYADTRHNMGFKVIDVLTKAMYIKIVKRKFGGLVGEGEFTDKKLILLKPMQFMNCSGQVVATAVGFYKIELSDLLVITDDMAIEPGRIRIRANGSSGGHNGLADIIEKIGTEHINRLRIGVGRSGELADYDYVLARPAEQQKTLLDGAIEKGKEAALYWLEYGIEAAMNKFNN